MILLSAVSGAVMAYCLVLLCLKTIFMPKIVIEQRIKETLEFDKSDFKVEEQTSQLNSIVKTLINRMLEILAVLIPKNQKMLESLAEQLRQAGIYTSAQNYQASVLLITICSTLICFFYGGIVSDNFTMRIGLGVLGIYGGVVLCRFRLKRQITSRKQEIYHQLPEMMDLLSVSVSAGLGFDQALTYIVEKNKGALFQELDIAQREIGMGRPRKEALEGLASRCDSQEMHTFVSAVNQADEMGASMQNILQIQSEIIRDTHKQGVEEKAQKLSVKMLIPMVIFIFPVIFIVLTGPAIISMMEMFG